MIALLILLSLVLGILASWIFLLRDCKRYNIPGPLPLPFVGNGHLFAVKTSKILPLLETFKQEYGDVYLMHLFHAPYVVISHPKYVEALVSHADLITKGTSYTYLRPWLGNGLLTSTGYRWRTTRKFLTPAFHFNILQNFLPVFLNNEKILIKKLKTYANGTPINVFPIIALTALDNVTESIMGVSVDAQINSESKYVKSIESLTKILSQRMYNPFMGEDAIFNLLPTKKIQDEAVRHLHGHTKRVIAKRRNELAIANITSSGNTSQFGIKNKHAFLDLLLLSEVDGKKIDDDYVREEVDTFMFEGHDTTTSGISFALYCLARHPQIQEKILEEQRTILGEKLDRDPTYSEIQQMKYLDLVIKESLRLYPSVPMIERLMTKDTEIAGLKLRKNTSVVVNIFEMHRHPECYEDPMEFRPERFDTSSAINSAKNAFSFLAFSAGPRNCIGQKFAMMEMKVTIASILRNFVIFSTNDTKELGLCSELILRAENGVDIELKPRIKITSLLSLSKQL